MMANHKPMVRAVPLDARPRKVEIKLYAGFYDVHVTGQNDERGFYRIRMRPAGSPKLIVANLASCSIGFLDRVATVGAARMPLTDVSVFYQDIRGRGFGNVLTGADKVSAAIDHFHSGSLDPTPADGAVATPDASATLVVLPPSPPAASPSMPPRAASPTIVYSRCNARLKKAENPNRLTMLEKAKLRKKLRREGSSTASDALIPAVELMELAADGGPPLPRKDVLQFADACGVSEIDLNKVAPTNDDV